MRADITRTTTTTVSTHLSRRKTWLLAGALALSWGSMLLHNQLELPLTPLSLENTGPLAVAGALLFACWRWPSSRLAWALTLAWGVLNLVVGGILTVLPLPVLPFAPEQTAQHYLVHALYSVGQLPLILLAVAALRQLQRRVDAEGACHV